VSRRSAPIASATEWSAGMRTCTKRRPQSGAGETSSTNRPLMPSPALLSASARFKARCTCRQNCCAFRWACRAEDRRPDSLSYRPSANSGSMNCDSLLRRLCCFKTKLPYWVHAHLTRAHTNCVRASTCILKAMGAGLSSRLAYAAVGRLDGIGKCAIGDMIFSVLRSSVRITERIIAQLTPTGYYRLYAVLMQVSSRTAWVDSADRDTACQARTCTSAAWLLCALRKSASASSHRRSGGSFVFSKTARAGRLTLRGKRVDGTGSTFVLFPVMR